MKGQARGVLAGVLLMVAMAAAAAADISGNWIMTVTTSMGSGSPTFTFVQKGENLTGTYKGQLGEQPVTGTIKGNDVTFEFQGEAQGQSFTVTYTGTLQGATMSGKVSLGQFAEGTFTGRKQ